MDKLYTLQNILKNKRFNSKLLPKANTIEFLTAYSATIQMCNTKTIGEAIIFKN